MKFYIAPNSVLIKKEKELMYEMEFNNIKDAQFFLLKREIEAIRTAQKNIKTIKDLYNL